MVQRAGAWRRFSSLLACAVFISPVVYSQQSSQSSSTPPALCLASAEMIWSKRPPAKASLPDPAMQEKDRGLLRPMRREEVRQMITALTPAAGKAGEVSIEQSLKRSGLSLQRLHVLVADATAMLASVHLEEALAQMGKLPQPDKAAIARGNAILNVIDRCGRGRYASAGGDPVYDQVRTMVLDHRAEIELTLMSGLQTPGTAGNVRAR